MSRRIYIRHADKEYMNGYGEIFKHDPDITEYGMERTKKVAKKLVENWGKPNRIVSSPYRRTRETALVLNSCLDQPFEEIFIDTTLSEYLGNHKGVPMDVTPNTKVYHPPHPETFDDLNKRISYHNILARRRANELNNGIIWYVTHGLVMKQLANMIGLRLNKQFPPLTCFSILEEEDIVKGEVMLFQGSLKTEKEHKNETWSKIVCLDN